MTPEQTAASYDKIAGHWDHPDFNHANGIEQHKRALGFAVPSGKALDVGCGSNPRIIDLLLKRGFEVEALDLSSEMLKRARLHHPDLRFHQADICTWEVDKSFDFISAWDSIWHVPLSQQTEVIQKLCGGLSPQGVLIFTSGGVYHPGEVTNPCFGQPLYHAAPGYRGTQLQHGQGAHRSGRLGRCGPSLRPAPGPQNTQGPGRALVPRTPSGLRHT